jgi:hypothetical protein
MNDLRCYARFPNSEISNPVPFQVPRANVAKPTCHCAKPDDPGHGPHFQLTQKVDGHTVTQSLPSPAAVRKAQNEIDEYRKFLSLTDDLVDVNRKICRLRPVEQAQQTAQGKKRRKPSSKKSPVK